MLDILIKETRLTEKNMCNLHKNYITHDRITINTTRKRNKASMKYQNRGANIQDTMYGWGWGSTGSLRHSVEDDTTFTQLPPSIITFFAWFPQWTNIWKIEVLLQSSSSILRAAKICHYRNKRSILQVICSKSTIIKCILLMIFILFTNTQFPPKWSPWSCRHVANSRSNTKLT